MSFDRDTVLAALTPEAVAEAYGLTGRWSGRWMRGRRCPAALHGTDAFGLSREGKWHCHACDEGGDLLSLIAVAERMVLQSDFGAILEIAAGIAGVEPEFSWDAPIAAPRKPTKPALVEKVPPLHERFAIARARCAWVWDHLVSPSDIQRVMQTGRHAYLESRGLPWKELPDHVQANVKDLGFWTIPGDYENLGRICAAGNEKDPARVSRTISKIFSSAYGVAIAVRHMESNEIVDIRARRAEVPDGEPKILGMPGGLTVHNGELVACYGSPAYLDKDLVIVVEGWADYLTAAWRWPHADVLGAVDAGQYPLVAGHAARYLAERGSGRIVLVAQDDGDEKDGRVPAAKRAVEAALKRAIGLVGPKAVRTWEARDYREKDLNDVVRAGRAHELPEEP